MLKKKIDMRLFLAIALTAIIASCEHDNTDPVGPNLFDRFGPFEYLDSLQTSSATVDFSAGETISFTAGFNKNVPWVLTITGQTTGAVKTITDFSDVLSAGNSTWNGSTTELPLFTNEMCMVVLSVPEETEFADTLMIDVTGTQSLDAGIVACDFDTFVVNGIQLGDFEFELTSASGRNNDITPAQGSHFFRLEGTDNESGGATDNFFVGLARIFPTANGNPDLTYFELPTTVPEQVYLNVFLNGRMSPFTRIVLGLIIDTNNSGTFDEGTDEIRSLEFDPFYSGWRIESFLGSDFGASQADLERLIGIEAALISLNNLQPSPREQVGFEMDYIVFTPNLPLTTE
ncbi:MAG: hypothetical protein MK086_03955 [Flavobacteriales bacterium]|nr:hypothetical protein [Flavobacteriales bacterium]